MKQFFFTIGLLFTLGTALFSQTYTVELRPDAANGQDAMIFERSDTYTRNYSRAMSMQISEWKGKKELYQQHQVLNFDLSDLPTDMVVKSAKLSLYFNPDNTDGRGAGHYGDVPTELMIHSIADPWDAETVNWDNRPAYTIDSKILLPGHTRKDQDYEDIDVTGIVSDMASGTSYGFYLQLAGDEPLQILKFASSNHTNERLHPRLTITFTSENYAGIPNVALPEIYPKTNDGRFLLDLEGVAPGRLQYQVFDTKGNKMSEPTEAQGRDLAPVRLAGPKRGEYYITFLLDGGILTTRKFSIK